MGYAINAKANEFINYNNAFKGNFVTVFPYT